MPVWHVKNAADHATDAAVHETSVAALETEEVARVTVAVHVIEKSGNHRLEETTVARESHHHLEEIGPYQEIAIDDPQYAEINHYLKSVRLLDATALEVEDENRRSDATEAVLVNHHQNHVETDLYHEAKNDRQL